MELPIDPTSAELAYFSLPAKVYIILQEDSGGEAFSVLNNAAYLTRSEAEAYVNYKIRILANLENWSPDSRGWSNGHLTWEIKEIDMIHGFKPAPEISEQSISSTQGHCWVFNPKMKRGGEVSHYLCKSCDGRGMEKRCLGEANKKSYIAAQKRKWRKYTGVRPSKK